MSNTHAVDFALDNETNGIVALKQSAFKVENFFLSTVFFGVKMHAIGNVEVFDIAVKPREIVIEGSRNNNARGSRCALASIPIRQVSDKKIVQSDFIKTAPLPAVFLK